ncbi:MAG TPA: hypothetical protein VGO47_13495 [Chlamydiales bacterium]|nr:hypothetical protein [Chlamydiales bacterium]
MDQQHLRRKGLGIRKMYRNGFEGFWFIYAARKIFFCIEFQKVLWTHFMDYHDWPKSWVENGEVQKCFSILDLDENYEVTDWKDFPISHLITKADLIEGKWEVPSVLTRTKKMEAKFDARKAIHLSTVRPC